MNKLTKYQLFCLTFLFQLGTTVIFGFAAATGRDAWIVTLISTFFGVALIFMYMGIMKMNPGLTLVEWYPQQLGKWIGLPIAFLYPLIFLFDAARIVTDLRDLIPTTILPQTPPIVIMILFMLIILYALYLGLHNVTRVAEIMVPFILILFIIEIIFLLMSKIVVLSLLKPILWDGWHPVLKAVFPEGISQTYGETIAMAMIWTQAAQSEKIWKPTLIATLLASLSFLTFDMLSIMIFGGVLFERSIYPFYTLTGMVNINGFITNLNPFAVMYFFITAFFKLFLKMYTGLAALQILIPYLGKRKRHIVWISALCVLTVGMVLSQNIAEHIYVLAIKQITPYVWIPLFIIFPVILFIVSSVRLWIQRRQKKQH
ncbi:spore germination protein KB [Paenibacillus sp. JGP012]|uniref:GerAB/ArcD/ProY family transporter n=1 Tax=Paenibacillus sp. JGP012 TaxID=2735914 RepID=UPI00161203CB|nr:endospore germination permease [Paenibacillus sp. JGP012]MBB6023887.1 spore germination protein KB [Paenibacillus sp. JGP012]